MGWDSKNSYSRFVTGYDFSHAEKGDRIWVSGLRKNSFMQTNPEVFNGYYFSRAEKAQDMIWVLQAAEKLIHADELRGFATRARL